MISWGNLVGYQAVWFSAVIGAGYGYAWPGVFAAALFAMSQLATSRRRGVELRLMLAAIGLGIVLDGGLAWTGAAHYAADSPALPPGGAPVWILALWSAFALTFTRSLAFLQTRLPLALALGAIGGPLAYFGAANGFDAVTFAVPEWRAMAWLAAGWGIATPLLAVLARERTRAAVARPIAAPGRRA